MNWPSRRRALELLLVVSGFVAPGQGAAQCSLPQQPTFGDLRKIETITQALPAVCAARVQGLEPATQQGMTIRESQCNETVALDHVRFFNRTDAFSRELIERLARSVAMLRPIPGAVLREGSRNRPGRAIAPDGLCTGALVGTDLLLTAGHCIDTFVNGTYRWTRSSQGSWRLAEPVDISRQLEAVFDYELSVECGCVEESSRAVVDLVAFRSAGAELVGDEAIPTEFALLRLAPDPPGKKSGEQRQALPFAAKNAPFGSALAILQHPDGALKHVGVGVRIKAADDTVRYNVIDTYHGTSGAAVFNADGEIVGLHVLGGCNSPDERRANRAITVERLMANADFRTGVGK